MNTIIDIYNKTLSYNKNDIQYELDKEGNIWFKFLNIVKILEYKSSKDTLKDKINKENKKELKEIRKLHSKERAKLKTKFFNLAPTIQIKSLILFELNNLKRFI